MVTLPKMTSAHVAGAHTANLRRVYLTPRSDVPGVACVLEAHSGQSDVRNTVTLFKSMQGVTGRDAAVSRTKDGVLEEEVVSTTQVVFGCSNGTATFSAPFELVEKYSRDRITLEFRNVNGAAVVGAAGTTDNSFRLFLDSNNATEYVLASHTNAALTSSAVAPYIVGHSDGGVAKGRVASTIRLEKTDGSIRLYVLPSQAATTGVLSAADISDFTATFPFTHA